MKRRIARWLVITALALMLIATTYQTTIWLKANETITARCIDSTGEIMVEPVSNGEVEITCRVWVER